MSAGARPRERVLLVGHGYAGRRFAAALDHLERSGAPIELVGVCEHAPERLPEGGVPAYLDLGEAIEAVAPTVACVTVNERAHAETFERLTAAGRLLVLSEKPLASSRSEINRAVEALRGQGFSMNMVERFSPAVAACRDWLDRAGPFEVIRVEAFWGKHRLGDMRPTMGVLSELVHSIDLARLVFGLEGLEVLGAHGTRSDFSPASPRATLDSVDVLASAAGVPVVFHSSFVWPRRVRMVSAVLSAPNGDTFRVELDFDNPHWDCDRFEAAAVAPGGRVSPVAALRTDVGDVPEPIRGIDKVTRYIESSVGEWHGLGTATPLVGLEEAVDLQYALAAIEDAVGLGMQTPAYRREKAWA